MRSLVAQFARFGVVGAIGFVIDTSIFALLIVTVLSDSVVHEGPLIAKVISTTVAIAFNWMGNRYWTFRAHRGRQLVREGVEFAIVSVGGMIIGLACLWVSHYLLGFTSEIADVISSNVIGLGLGTLFRFTLYRVWVFAPHRGEPEPALFPEMGTGSVPVSPSVPSAVPAPAPAAAPAPSVVAQPRPSAR